MVSSVLWVLEVLSGKFCSVGIGGSEWFMLTVSIKSITACYSGCLSEKNG